MKFIRTKNTGLCCFKKHTIMKNPFAKQNNRTLIALGVTGAAAAGAIAYLYFTENGNTTRNKISDNLGGGLDKLGKTIKDTFNDVVAGIISDKTPVSKKTAKAVVEHVNK
jgi:hypothetical protein